MSFWQNNQWGISLSQGKNAFATLVLYIVIRTMEFKFSSRHEYVYTDRFLDRWLDDQCNHYIPLDLPEEKTSKIGYNTHNIYLQWKLIVSLSLVQKIKPSKFIQTTAASLLKTSSLIHTIKVPITGISSLTQTSIVPIVKVSSMTIEPKIKVGSITI